MFLFTLIIEILELITNTLIFYIKSGNSITDLTPVKTLADNLPQLYQYKIRFNTNGITNIAPLDRLFKNTPLIKDIELYLGS